MIAHSPVLPFGMDEHDSMRQLRQEVPLNCRSAHQLLSTEGEQLCWCRWRSLVVSNYPRPHICCATARAASDCCT